MLYKNISEQEFVSLKSRVEKIKGNLAPFCKENNLHIQHNFEYDDFTLSINFYLEEGELTGSMGFSFIDSSQEHQVFKFGLRKVYYEGDRTYFTEKILFEKLNIKEIEENVQKYIQEGVKVFNSIRKTDLKDFIDAS